MTLRCDHLVVDSSAFIKNAPLRNISDDIYTIAEVVEEIRDESTKRSLQVLPYNLHFKQPNPESVKEVSNFAKKTGDFASLSSIDIKLIALTLDLTKQYAGTEGIRTDPVISKKIVYSGSNAHKQEDKANLSLIGFFMPKEEATGGEAQGGPADPPVEKMSTDLDEEKPCHSASSASEVLPDDQKVEELNEEEADDDDEGWITPENLNSARLAMESTPEVASTVPEHCPVGCITTDFAMQNVMLQMGLRILSLNGFIIRQAKTFILRCHACYTTTDKMEKKFCPGCGNLTLRRVAVTVNADGSQTLHLSKRKTIQTRGCSLPMPRGGKHANNPILTEDQPIPQNRPTKKWLLRNDALDPDYIAGSSPFVTRDLTSRAFQLGITGKTKKRPPVLANRRKR